MRPRALPTLLLVAVLFILAYAGWRVYAERPLEPVGEVRIAASLTVSPALIWIAQDQGLFARAGLNATVTPCDTGKACAEAMLSGQADLAAAAEFLAARLAFKEKSLRILGSTTYVHTIRVIAPSTSGIRAPADLKGKRVGVKLGTNGEYFLARLLTLHGLARADIQWVDLKPQALADALAAGQVDAVLTWPPHTHRVEARLAGQAVSFDGQPGQDYYYLLLAHQDWLAAHPQVAERVMRALKWAEAWMADHPEAARAYLAGKLGVPAAELDEDLRGSRFAVGLPQTLLTALEVESRWLTEQGTPGSPVVNSLDLIATAPLAAVAPESVTLVRGGRR